MTGVWSSSYLFISVWKRMGLFLSIFFLLPCVCFAEVKAWKCVEMQCLELSSQEMKDLPIQDLPEDFIIPPGCYRFKDKHFFIDKGLLRIADIPYENEQRLVWDGDLYLFLSGLTWAHAHGYEHEYASYQESIDICKKRKLFKICGGFSTFTQILLEKLGIPTRLVCFLTLDPWNCYDNGHTCVEVYWEGRWQLIDIDLKQMILVNDKVISAIDFPSAIKAERYSIKKLSNAPVLSSHLILNGYDYGLWMEAILTSPENMKKWYRRCADVVLINDSGSWWFHHKEKEKVLGYSGDFRFLEKEAFEKTIYPIYIHSPVCKKSF